MNRPQTSPPPAPPPAPPGASRGASMEQLQPQTGPVVDCDAVQFLDRAGLGVYSPVFYSHGFTTIDSLLTIRHEDLTRMNVKASHQNKLKRALENFRATGQINPPGYADPSTPPQPPSYAPQLPPGGAATGGAEAVATGALAGTGVADGLGPGVYGQGYSKGGLWIDTNQEAGANPPYQWVDGPPGGGMGLYGVDPNAQAAQQAAQLQAHQQQTAVGGSPYGQYPQGAGAQWVDSPTGPASPPVAQDMVFQWVDSPSHARLHQQHYLQAPQVSPYYPGLEGLGHLDALRSPTGLHGRPGLGLDPHSPYAAAQGIEATMAGVPQYPGGVADASGRYAPAHDAAGLYDQHLGYQSNPPSPQVGSGHYSQRRDLQSQYGRNDDRGRDHYGGQGGYQLFDQSGNRGQGKGHRQGQDSRQSGQKKQLGPGADDGSRARGRGRQDGMTNDAAPGGRANAAQATTMENANLERTMGPDVLRSMLISALESLYEDRIKPMANYVKGRLKERSCPDSFVKNFVDLYAEHQDLFQIVRPSQLDEEVTIFMIKEPSWFKGWVDIDSPDDPYEESMWEAFEKFLDGEHTFAGGRYGMARELMQRHLPFLAPHSLGEVCHIVQLAIQHRRLIVYHRKMLKPIQTVLQPSPAAVASVVGTTEGEDIKDMDDLCCVLFRMLLHHPQGLRLCRLKQMIKHEFSRKLSEMSFQCTKLIELFNTEPLQSTFVLDTENDGKSIYVRMGNPDTFTDHIKRIYTLANTTEAQRC